MRGRKFALILALLVQLSTGETGVITLDSLSFNKTTQAFPFTFVKFDSKAPAGPKHEAFVRLAQELHDQEKILVAEVRIPGYGSPVNHDLAERFGLNQGVLPEFIFLKRKKLPGKKYEQIVTRYGDVIDLDHMRRFLQMKTGLWIGLDGCVKEFDELAAIFTRNSGKDQLKVIQQTEEQIKKFDGEKASIGKRYLKVMKIVMQRGLEFVTSEEQRITKLLQEKITDEKRAELQRNLNLLKSFHSSAEKPLRKNDEL